MYAPPPKKKSAAFIFVNEHCHELSMIMLRKNLNTHACLWHECVRTYRVSFRGGGEAQGVFRPCPQNLSQMSYTCTIATE